MEMFKGILIISMITWIAILGIIIGIYIIVNKLILEDKEENEEDKL